MFNQFSEKKIQDAIQAGEFDNLPGKGKPLTLDDNPFEPPEQRAANHLLKNNGFTLPWIEAGNEIEAERLEARTRLRRAHESATLNPRTTEWELARATFAEQVCGLNRRILSYNLTVPSPHFQKNLIDLESETALALAPQTP